MDTDEPREKKELLGLELQEDPVDAGAQVSSKPPRPGEGVEDVQLTGNKPVNDIVLQPRRAKMPHVTKLCHAPAVAIRSFEGVDKERVGLFSRLEPWGSGEGRIGRGRATKNVGIARCRWNPEDNIGSDSLNGSY